MIVSGGPPPKPGTLNELFFHASEEHDKQAALQYKSEGSFKGISHRELLERVRHVARGLRLSGVKRGDRVAILSENRPEWAIADYACLTAGLTDVPIYPTLPAEQIAYILGDSEAVGIFVSNAEQAGKIASIRSELPTIRVVISFDESVSGTDMSIAALEAKGREGETAESVAEYRRQAEEVKPDDLATLIYTSGTTGPPKGVMLTHNNIHSNVAATRDKIPFTDDDVSLSFLPLSHIFERMGDYMMFATGVSIAYAETYRQRTGEHGGSTAVDRSVSPPSLREDVCSGSPERSCKWRRKEADLLLGSTRSGTMGRYDPRRTQAGLGARQAIRPRAEARLFQSEGADRRKTPLLRLRGAPLASEINKFFYAVGLTILEGYGLTETSPVIAVNTPDAFRIGTVGKPIAGVEVEIAADGEILTRGPGVMKGYYNNPVATAEAIDGEGWFHTGDIGEIRDGFLAITDRKKDIIVTAGGKNIAPQPIEIG